jgi:hypothetical protein
MISFFGIVGKARCVHCCALPRQFITISILHSAEIFEPFQQMASQGNGPAFVLY